MKRINGQDLFKYCPDEGDKWTGSCPGERDRQDLVKGINGQDLVQVKGIDRIL